MTPRPQKRELTKLLVGYWIFAPLANLGPRPPSEYPSSRYDKDAERAFEWARSVENKGKPEVPSCDQEEGDKCRERWKESLDLSAQWVASQAARQMAWLTQLQTIIGAIGLFSVGVTGYYARKAWVAADENAKAALRMAHSAEESERAYVTLSHNKPLEVRQSQGTVRVELQVKNWGRTPAHVTDVVVRIYALGNTTAIFEATNIKRTQAFLVANDSVTWYDDFQVGRTLLGEVEAEAAGVTLWLVGYCDYTDKFGGRHRSSFSRKYVPTAPVFRAAKLTDGTVVTETHQPNNLVFGTSSFPNNDRRRGKGEGDWSDPAAEPKSS